MFAFLQRAANLAETRQVRWKVRLDPSRDKPPWLNHHRELCVPLETPA